MKDGILVLEDGTVFTGKCFGAMEQVYGELVFNTSMAGYQEIITDPSYKGQIITMTYPLFGNYGFNSYDSDSPTPHLNGLVVKELCEFPSNHRSEMTAEEYMIKYKKTGISQIDTRALTQHLRDNGSMYGIISTDKNNVPTLLKMVKEKSRTKEDLVAQVSTKEIKHIEGNGPRISVLDLGITNSILDFYKNMDCNLYLFPAKSSWKKLMAVNPDGILLSNGPGDPTDAPYAIDTAKNLIGKIPIIGMCMGFLILSLALGGETYKMKFGHHGANIPVKDLRTNKVHITSQNHTYTVKNLPLDDLEITNIDINDNSVEGFKHKKYPIISLQYYPPDSDTQFKTKIQDMLKMK